MGKKRFFDISWGCL